MPRTIAELRETRDDRVREEEEMARQLRREELLREDPARRIAQAQWAQVFAMAICHLQAAELVGHQYFSTRFLDTWPVRVTWDCEPHRAEVSMVL